MEFCPKCKTMMVPVKGAFKCRNAKCGYVKEKDAGQGSLLSKAARSDREVTVLEGNTDQGLPTTSVRCEECGHNVAYWWLRQLRSADESETRFFKCTKCGATWREYD
ncbi:MAG: transcription factor [Methanolobus sp.]|nr:transcription factor [Methanolobus sp.]MDK2912200.1 transcription factor [Methanolobus sp.]MDN5310402.1 transcription factor [Methanolobus sp.]